MTFGREGTAQLYHNTERMDRFLHAAREATGAVPLIARPRLGTDETLPARAPGSESSDRPSLTALPRLAQGCRTMSGHAPRRRAAARRPAQTRAGASYAPAMKAADSE